MSIPERVRDLGTHAALVRLRAFVDAQALEARDIRTPMGARYWQALGVELLEDFEHAARHGDAQAAAKHAARIRWTLLVARTCTAPLLHRRRQARRDLRRWLG